MAHGIQNAMREIFSREDDTPDVMLLSRYNFLLNDKAVVEAIKPYEKDGLKVVRSTIHRSKGREASEVIVLGNESGLYGFPTEIVDDPVLNMVSAESQPYPHAEERRLFYVALTRTRGRVYLLVPENNPSAFVQELLDGPYEDHIELIGETSERYRCPVCHGRTIRRTQGTYGTFWACLHFPRCSGKLMECQECGVGVWEPQLEAGRIREFMCTNCKMVQPACPDAECRVGVLVRRDGPHGSFLGCSEWRRDGSGCNHTTNA